MDGELFVGELFGGEFVGDICDGLLFVVFLFLLLFLPFVSALVAPLLSVVSLLVIKVLVGDLDDLEGDLDMDLVLAIDVICVI